MDNRTSALLDFLILSDQLKLVERRGYVGQGERRENSAEHTWHVALTALLLQPEIALHADLGRTLEMILVHDLVEIYAGDTYAYDEAGRTTQHEREEQAALRLFGVLPPDAGSRMLALWHEFEANQSNEARFANACDRMQGFLQNYLSGGRSWREHGITREMTRRRSDQPRQLDPVLRAIIDEAYQRADQRTLWDTAPSIEEQA